MIRSTMFKPFKFGPRQGALFVVVSSALFLGVFMCRWLKSESRMSGKRKSRNLDPRIPSKWNLCGHITNLFVYPLKSGRGVRLNEAEATELGLKCGPLRDRFFLVYDENGNFVTGRKYPKMVLISVSALDSGLFCFNAPGVEMLIIPLPHESKIGRSKTFRCRLWRDEVQGLDAGDSASIWISRVLLGVDVGLRIGCYVPELGVERNVTPLNQVYKSLTTEDTGAFSDLAAYLLVTEDSVADLNSRLSENDKVSFTNFRPNLIVKCLEGVVPYDEDNWQWIRVGNGPVFRNVKPCTRCVFTTIDPERGIANKHREPLSTLKTYHKVVDPEAIRLEGAAPVMGINLGLYLNGSLQVGDPVYIGS